MKGLEGFGLSSGFRREARGRGVDARRDTFRHTPSYFEVFSIFSALAFSWRRWGKSDNSKWSAVYEKPLNGGSDGFGLN